MSDKVAKAGRPQLRGLLQSQIKKNLVVAIGLCIVVGVADKILVNDAAKARTANFYKNYDVEKTFNMIRNRGMFDSCEAD